MFTDTIEGLDVVGVYCTLCGAMIVYETNVDGTRHKLGTSGFLYRSNKLMYDRSTSSLWNTFWGRPVIGPLTDKGVSLKRRSVVTTTWGEWKSRHPDTTVLSLNTGYKVDYSEGIAYKDYFATDKLMFSVPELDNRLKNKAEVLGILPDEAGDGLPLAISADYLRRHPVYYGKSGHREIVVLTDASGANRVYKGGIKIDRWLDRNTLIDSQGQNWKVTESGLHSESGQTHRRLAAHRAFWFGWYSAFPNTSLLY